MLNESLRQESLFKAAFSIIRFDIFGIGPGVTTGQEFSQESSRRKLDLANLLGLDSFKFMGQK
jgi:hypothetical protein